MDNMNNAFESASPSLADNLHGDLKGLMEAFPAGHAFWSTPLHVDLLRSCAAGLRAMAEGADTSAQVDARIRALKSCAEVFSADEALEEERGKPKGFKPKGGKTPASRQPEMNKKKETSNRYKKGSERKANDSGAWRTSKRTGRQWRPVNPAAYAKAGGRGPIEYKNDDGTSSVGVARTMRGSAKFIDRKGDLKGLPQNREKEVEGSDGKMNVPSSVQKAAKKASQNPDTKLKSKPEPKKPAETKAEAPKKAAPAAKRGASNKVLVKPKKKAEPAEKKAAERAASEKAAAEKKAASEKAAVEKKASPAAKRDAPKKALAKPKKKAPTQEKAASEKKDAAEKAEAEKRAAAEKVEAEKKAAAEKKVSDTFKAISNEIPSGDSEEIAPFKARAQNARLALKKGFEALSQGDTEAANAWGRKANKIARDLQNEIEKKWSERFAGDAPKKAGASSPQQNAQLKADQKYKSSVEKEAATGASSAGASLERAKEAARKGDTEAAKKHLDTAKSKAKESEAALKGLSPEDVKGSTAYDNEARLDAKKAKGAAQKVFNQVDNMTLDKLAPKPTRQVKASDTPQQKAQKADSKEIASYKATASSLEKDAEPRAKSMATKADATKAQYEKMKAALKSGDTKAAEKHMSAFKTGLAALEREGKELLDNEKSLRRGKRALGGLEGTELSKGTKDALDDVRTVMARVGSMKSDLGGAERAVGKEKKPEEKEKKAQEKDKAVAAEVEKEKEKVAKEKADFEAEKQSDADAAKKAFSDASSNLPKLDAQMAEIQKHQEKGQAALKAGKPDAAEEHFAAAREKATALSREAKAQKRALSSHEAVADKDTAKEVLGKLDAIAQSAGEVRKSQGARDLAGRNRAASAMSAAQRGDMDRAKKQVDKAEAQIDRSVKRGEMTPEEGEAAKKALEPVKQAAENMPVMNRLDSLSPKGYQSMVDHFGSPEAADQARHIAKAMRSQGVNAFLTTSTTGSGQSKPALELRDEEGRKLGAYYIGKDGETALAEMPEDPRKATGPETKLSKLAQTAMGKLKSQGAKDALSALAGRRVEPSKDSVEKFQSNVEMLRSLTTGADAKARKQRAKDTEQRVAQAKTLAQKANDDLDNLMKSLPKGMTRKARDKVFDDPQAKDAYGKLGDETDKLTDMIDKAERGEVRPEELDAQYAKVQRRQEELSAAMVQAAGENPTRRNRLRGLLNKAFPNHVAPPSKSDDPTQTLEKDLSKAEKRATVARNAAKGIDKELADTKAELEKLSSKYDGDKGQMKSDPEYKSLMDKKRELQVRKKTAEDDADHADKMKERYRQIHRGLEAGNELKDSEKLLKSLDPKLPTTPAQKAFLDDFRNAPENERAMVDLARANLDLKELQQAAKKGEADPTEVARQQEKVSSLRKALSARVDFHRAFRDGQKEALKKGKISPQAHARAEKALQKAFEADEEDFLQRKRAIQKQLDNPDLGDAGREEFQAQLDSLERQRAQRYSSMRDVNRNLVDMMKATPLGEPIRMPTDEAPDARDSMMQTLGYAGNSMGALGATSNASVRNAEVGLQNRFEKEKSRLKQAFSNAGVSKEAVNDFFANYDHSKSASEQLAGLRQDVREKGPNVAQRIMGLGKEGGLERIFNKLMKDASKFDSRIKSQRQRLDRALKGAGVSASAYHQARQQGTDPLSQMASGGHVIMPEDPGSKFTSSTPRRQAEDWLRSRGLPVPDGNQRALNRYVKTMQARYYPSKVQGWYKADELGESREVVAQRYLTEAQRFAPRAEPLVEWMPTTRKDYKTQALVEAFGEAVDTFLQVFEEARSSHPEIYVQWLAENIAPSHIDTKALLHTLRN